MTPLALLVLLAASSVELVDEVYQIPPAEWKYIEVNLRQRPARVTAAFVVDTGSRQGAPGADDAADLERLREDEPHGLLAVTEFRKSGALRFPRP